MNFRRHAVTVAPSFQGMVDAEHRNQSQSRGIAASLALALALLLGAGWAHCASPDGGHEVTVRVEIQDDTVRVSADMALAASVQEVWAVLTDFENLPQFISSITSSKVLSRDGNLVRVAQTGKAGFGPFTFEFKSTRQMTLAPYEKFESEMIEGNMKRFRGTTRLESVAGTTRIRFHSEAVPDTILPLRLARSTIESGTREHYLEIGREVARRKGTAPAR